MAAVKRQKWQKWQLLIFLLVAAVYFVRFITARAAAHELTVAVVAPFSGSKAFMGPPVKEGVQLAIDELNDKGGIGGRRVRLLIIDDANDPQSAEREARKLGSQGRTLVVFGHRTSETCIPAGKIYAQLGLPAITASASAPEVTAGNPWYFRIVSSSTSQGQFLAQYAREVLSLAAVRVVADDSVYGQTLLHAFKEAAEPLGIHIENEWSVSSREDLAAQLDAVGRQIAATGGKTPIVLAVGEAVAVRLLIAMRDAGERAPMLGGQVMGSQTFNDHFSNLPAERRQPGFYTDGLFASTVGLIDTSGESAQRFYRRYREVFHHAADTMSAAYYDAAVLALQGLEATRATGDDLPAERQHLREFLAHFTSPQDAFVGTTGRIFFDENRSAVKSVAVGRFEGGRFIAAPIQLDLIPRPASVPNFEAELKAGNIVAQGGLYWSKVQVVYVGVDVLSVPDINQKTGEFAADMFVWFRYQGPSPVEELEFPNAVGNTSFGKPVWVRQRDNLTVATYRVTGTFKARFNFADYPLDHQVLPIKLRHGTKTISTVIMATDTRGMTIKDRRFDELALAKLRSSFAGSTWGPSGVLFYQTNFKSDSTLGENDLLYADTGLEYSQITAAIEVHRNFASYFLKNLMPLALIIIVLYMCNFLPPLEIETQVNIGITALLTSIVLYQSLSSEMSAVGYLTVIDYVYFTAFALCIVEVSASILGFIAEKRGRFSAVKKLKQLGLFLIPTTIVLTAVAIYLLHRRPGT